MDRPEQQLTIDELFTEIPADIDISQFSLDSIPNHLAVIMDGNGRWAKQREQNRVLGHRAGIKAVRELISISYDLGIRYLTIFSFSTENWSRPEYEVNALMTLFAQTMSAELEALHHKGVQIRIIGDLDSLPRATRVAFEKAAQQTADNQNMTLIIAVNYGGRQEIIKAVQKIARAAAGGEMTAQDIENLTSEQISDNLSTAGLPDPDLMIRTSGELRISNFMLYQLAYSELYFSPVLWPDFDRYELLRALISYQSRSRRFGNVK